MSDGGAGAVKLEIALERILSGAGPLGPERLRLAEAAGRRLAESIASPVAVPGFDNSAMDGYAVRSEDVAPASSASPVQLRVVDAARAGVPAKRGPGAGETVEIATGGAMPPGADAIVRIEEVDRQGEWVAVTGPVPPGRDLRRRAEDLAEGDAVLERGARLGPAELGLLATLGIPSIMCVRRPRVALVTSGDELTDPGGQLAPGAVYDSSSFALGAMIAAAGGEQVLARAVPDRPADTVEAISEGLEADVLVTCGGVSVGRHDLVRSSLLECGVEEAFHGIALKPGQPTWFGRRRSTRAFGLPGSPVTAMVTFALLVAPLLRVLGGAPRPEPDRYRLASPVEPDPRCVRAIPCRPDASDRGLVCPVGRRGSHLLSRLTEADRIAHIPPAAEPLAAGSEVECMPLPGG